MERAISEMEKIRKAEEIYSKRNNIKLENEEVNKNKSLYKILFQILVLLNVAVVIVAIQNKDYIFTIEFLDKVNQCNINIKEKIEEMFTYSGADSDNTVSDDDLSENNGEDSKEETDSNENTEASDSTENNSNSEGALVDNEETKELSQMEQDAEIIKNNYSLILPVEGIKTSGFGVRESDNSKVTKNHTGVDIAANTGTVIKSAIDGQVTQVSEEGDYGKHLKITKDNLTILYAHCSKIYVSEGDEIKQGQDVAEVGSTGNSTGPHLHFEIRYEDRYVDPELILKIS